MDLDRVIGEACEEYNGKANVKARDDVNVYHATEDAAIRETSIDFMFHGATTVKLAAES
jgi:hypothetical protein